MIRARRRRDFLIAFVLLCSAVAAAIWFDARTAPRQVALSPGEANPALWAIEDGDTTLYLLGTVHALPASTEWRDADIERAIEQSDSLVLEIADQDRVDEASLFRELATADRIVPLPDRLGPANREALAALIGQLGLRRLALDRLDSWAAALVIGNALSRQAGMDGEWGVEAILTAQFLADGKPVRGLETTEQQLRLFDALSEEQQRAMLAEVIAAAPGTADRISGMVDAWLAGDTQSLNRLLAETIEKQPELRAALLNRRNAAWAGQLAEMLDRPGTVMVAVGAGHLLGSGSVQERIADQTGLAARRID